MVGDFIKSRRKRLGISQGKLSQLVSLPQSYVSRIERGDIGLPRREKLELFASVLQCSVGDFYRAAGMDPGTPPVEGQVAVTAEDAALLDLIHGDADLRALLEEIGADQLKAERALLELWRPYLNRMVRDGKADES